jgi:hypothetical protein
VAPARKVRLIGESRKKDDRLDARTLARLARIDPQLLAPVKHRTAEAQAHLMVIRARAGLVRARTSLINTARGLTKSYGERLRGCNPRNMNAEKVQGLSAELQAALEPLLAGIESLSEQIREYNERIEHLAQTHYHHTRMRTPLAPTDRCDGAGSGSNGQEKRSQDDIDHVAEEPCRSCISGTCAIHLKAPFRWHGLVLSVDEVSHGRRKEYATVSPPDTILIL